VALMVGARDQLGISLTQAESAPGVHSPSHVVYVAAP
jgi:hypothetical protein